MGQYQQCSRNNSGADAPGRLPGLLMVAADAQADLAVGLEAAARGGEAEARGPERVGRGQDDAAVVEAGAVDRVGGPAQGEVPLEEVRLERLGGVVGGRAAGELGSFTDCGRGESQWTIRNAQGRSGDTDVFVGWWATWC